MSKKLASAYDLPKLVLILCSILSMIIFWFSNEISLLLFSLHYKIYATFTSVPTDLLHISSDYR